MSTYQIKIETKTTLKIEHNISDHPVKGIASPDNRFYFHLIPKNASRFIAGHLMGLGWVPVYDISKLDYQYKLVILRNPISRWVSGIVEFFYLNNLITDDFENDWNIYKKLLEHQPVQDGHTLGQTEFLYGVPLDGLDFLLIPENMENIGTKIQHWLNSKGHENEFYRYDAIDNSFDNRVKLKILNTIKHTAYHDENFNSKLRDHFRSSYDLIKWVSENNRWI